MVVNWLPRCPLIQLFCYFYFTAQKKRVSLIIQSCQYYAVFVFPHVLYLTLRKTSKFPHYSQCLEKLKPREETFIYLNSINQTSTMQSERRKLFDTMCKRRQYTFQGVRLCIQKYTDAKIVMWSCSCTTRQTFFSRNEFDLTIDIHSRQTLLHRFIAFS